LQQLADFGFSGRGIFIELLVDGIQVEQLIAFAAQHVDVIKKVLEAYTGENEFTIRYLASTREVTDSQEYVIITLDFQALHTI